LISAQPLPADVTVTAAALGGAHLASAERVTGEREAEPKVVVP
jgi:hypothetical protein